ncbi:TPA: DUF6387 family protein [Yersinia enterocolitica]
MAIPKNINELDKQLSDLAEEIHSADDFFSILQENKLSAKDLATLVDVRKYDEITKDFDPLQYYVSFVKRREALFHLEYIEGLKKETYEEYLDAGDDFVSEADFIKERQDEISIEQMELLPFVTRLIAGDNVSIFQEDIKFGDGWQLQTPIRTIDMKGIAFENHRNGIFGGMSDEVHNNLIFKIICGDANGDDIRDLRCIPDGYGWPELGLNQRVWAEIDVNTPDEILIEAFKNWLKEAKKMPVFTDKDIPYHLLSEGVMKSNHIKKWYSLRVLAYLDLKIYALISGVRITMKQYGDILYFDEFDIDATEKVRKTLIPLVNEIFSGGYLNNLMKKIIAENC